MKCDCLGMMEENLKSNGYKDAKIDRSFSFPDMEVNLTIPFTFVNDKGKKKNQNLMCVFCPFCGKHI